MAKETIYLTAEGYKKLKEELDHMRSVERPAISAAIAEARDKGDLSENAEYDAAKNEQAKNEYDIVQLENELRNAKVIDETTIDTSVVGVGAVVQLKNAENGMELSFQIVGSAETDPAQGKISNESPVGKALLGHRAGDAVDVTTPAGVMHFMIQSIGR